jgi:hypothetical protein
MCIENYPDRWIHFASKFATFLLGGAKEGDTATTILDISVSLAGHRTVAFASHCWGHLDTTGLRVSKRLAKSLL